MLNLALIIFTAIVVYGALTKGEKSLGKIAPIIYVAGILWLVAKGPIGWIALCVAGYCVSRSRQQIRAQ